MLSTNSFLKAKVNCLMIFFCSYFLCAEAGARWIVHRDTTCSFYRVFELRNTWITVKLSTQFRNMLMQRSLPNLWKARSVTVSKRWLPMADRTLTTTPGHGGYFQLEAHTCTSTVLQSVSFCWSWEQAGYWM